MRPLLLAAALSILALAPSSADAQTVGARQRVVLTDGRTLVGTVVEVRADAVVLDVRGVRSEVLRTQIARVEDPGRFDLVDPLGTRLFLTPTARTMPKGSLRLSTVYVVLPNVAYGVTGNLDVSATASIPIVDGGTVSANVKFAPVRTDGLTLAVGASVGTVYGPDVTSPAAGTFYGVATIGNERRAVTLGAYGLYAGYEGELEVGNGVGAVLGGEMQVSNHIKVISENGFFRTFDSSTAEGSTNGLLTAGVRFFSERLAADVSYPFLAYEGTPAPGEPALSSTGLPFPLVSFSYTIR